MNINDFHDVTVTGIVRYLQSSEACLVWLADISRYRVTELEAAHGDWLDEAERCRLTSFRNDAARRSFLLSRLLLRRILGAATGKPESEVSLNIGALGKPRLADGQLEFNLSHGGNWIAIALSQFPVGIDVECLGNLTSVGEEGLFGLKMAFTPCERQWLSRLELSVRRSEVLRLWTLKEAISKCAAQGLSMGFDRMDLVSLLYRRAPSISGYRLNQIRLAGDDILSLARLGSAAETAILVELEGFPTRDALSSLQTGIGRQRVIPLLCNL